ncbi:hypothetical protein FRC03_005247 [Tulasnella sp. 419]|nr:hypothetical protein FRC03_005247 [Tulasnella sp. 419]
MPSLPSPHHSDPPQHHPVQAIRHSPRFPEDSGPSSGLKDRSILTPMRSPRRPSESPNSGSKEQSADEDNMKDISPATSPTNRQSHSLALKTTDMETDQNLHGSVEVDHHVQKRGADVESEEDLEPLRGHVPPPRSHILVDDRKSPPPSPSSNRLHLRARSGSRTSYPGGGANSPILHSGPSSPTRSPKAHLKPLFPQDLHQRAMSPPLTDLRKSPPPHPYPTGTNEPRVPLHRHHRVHQAIPTPPLSATTASLIFPLAATPSGPSGSKLASQGQTHSTEVPRVEAASLDSNRRQPQAMTASGGGSKSHQKRIHEFRTQKADEPSSSNSSRQTDRKPIPQQRSDQPSSPLSRRATLPSPRTPSARSRADLLLTSPKLSPASVTHGTELMQSTSRTNVGSIQPAYPPQPAAPPTSTPSSSSQNKQHVCQICTLAFARAHDLKRHTTTHTGEKNFVCPNCLKKYARKDALKRHACTRAPPAGGVGVTGSTIPSGGGGGSVMGLGAGAGLGPARAGLVSVGQLRPPTRPTQDSPSTGSPGYHTPSVVGAATTAVTTSARSKHTSPSPISRFREQGGRLEEPEPSSSRSRFPEAVLRQPSPSLSPPSPRRSSPSPPLQTPTEPKTETYASIQSRTRDLPYPLPPLVLPPLPRPRAPSEDSESGSDSLRGTP